MVNPGIVNVIELPPFNSPAVNEMVKIKGPNPVSTAVPARPPGEKAGNMRVAAPASAKPAPVSVMRSLLLLETTVTEVKVTLMVTNVAPLATLLKVRAGKLKPRLSTMEVYEPVTVVSRTTGDPTVTSNEVPAGMLANAS